MTKLLLEVNGFKLADAQFRFIADLEGGKLTITASYLQGVEPMYVVSMPTLLNNADFDMINRVTTHVKEFMNIRDFVQRLLDDSNATGNCSYLRENF